MGPIVAHLDDLPEHFVAMNGDVLTNLDDAALLRRHTASDGRLTAATYNRTVRIDFGVLGITGDR